MSTQPKALRLADLLDEGRAAVYRKHTTEAAAELRRLHGVNQELLNALKRLMRSFPTDADLSEAKWDGHEIEEALSAHDAARAALAKTQGEQA